ncbi:hypothetical protein OIV83_004943 [Microbotryomycetes sp. JL201]|nr:hypothetical protein OIV83_004943 [Microbotryomycetes sp. JL201]
MQAVALSPPDGHAVQLAAQDVRNGRLPTRLPSATLWQHSQDDSINQVGSSVNVNDRHGAASAREAPGTLLATDKGVQGVGGPSTAIPNPLKDESVSSTRSTEPSNGAAIESDVPPHALSSEPKSSPAPVSARSVSNPHPPSIVTSGNLFFKPRPSAAQGVRGSSSTPFINDHGYSSDLEPTAALIQQLYARLDAQGVVGDGWAEGKERSRDGLINRIQTADDVEGQRTLKAEDQYKQQQTLTGLDRYGFFPSSHPGAISSQHHRVSSLNASAYETLAGSRFKRLRGPQDRKQAQNRETTPVIETAETRRIDKWSEMLHVVRRDDGGNIAEWAIQEDWWNGRDRRGVSSGKYRKLQRRIYKGVPDRWRRAVWMIEMERMARENGSSATRVPSLPQLEKEYWALVEQPSAQDIQIDLDVPRTISGHVLFHTRYGQGQRALFHVLHAAGLRCLDIGGYCQGMGPIAATLLCYFEPERAYASLIRLFDQYRLGDIFAPGFPGLVENFHVQERLVEYLMPEEKHGISSSSYATKWYITLFANTVPFETQLRFWDALLLEGIDFLVVAAVAVIWNFRHQFVDAEFEDILSALSSYFEVESNDSLMRWIRKTLRMKGIRAKMAQWREEWRASIQVT